MSETAGDWHPTACVLCSINCGLEVRVDDRAISRVRGDKAHPGSLGYTCEKGLRVDHYQSDPHRLTSPLRRRPDGTFEGVQREGTLVIVLLPGDLSSGDCTELRLAIPIGAGGEWGRAGVLFDDGCMPDGMDLVFAPMPPGSFFPP